MDVVDHLLFESHKKASEFKQLDLPWKSQSSSHPWVHCSTKHKQENVEMFIRMAIDVYNDSLYLTPTAFSWLRRCLASLHSEKLISFFRENGFGQQLQEHTPPGSVLHYRDQANYSEMLQIIEAAE